MEKKVTFTSASCEASQSSTSVSCRGACACGCVYVRCVPSINGHNSRARTGKPHGAASATSDAQHTRVAGAAEGTNLAHAVVPVVSAAVVVVVGARVLLFRGGGGGGGGGTPRRILIAVIGVVVVVLPCRAAAKVALLEGGGRWAAGVAVGGTREGRGGPGSGGGGGECVGPLPRRSDPLAPRRRPGLARGLVRGAMSMGSSFARVGHQPLPRPGQHRARLHRRGRLTSYCLLLRLVMRRRHHHGRSLVHCRFRPRMSRSDEDGGRLRQRWRCRGTCLVVVGICAWCVPRSVRVVALLRPARVLLLVVVVVVEGRGRQPRGAGEGGGAYVEAALARVRLAQVGARPRRQSLLALPFRHCLLFRWLVSCSFLRFLFRSLPPPREQDKIFSLIYLLTWRVARQISSPWRSQAGLGGRF